MSTTGERGGGGGQRRRDRGVDGPPGATREAVIEGAVLSNRVMGSPSYPTPRTRSGQGGASVRSRVRPGGIRPSAAGLPDHSGPYGGAAPARLPALVVHGAADPLIGVSGGRATAAAIPGSELLVIDGVGHEAPGGRAARRGGSDRRAGPARRARRAVTRSPTPYRRTSVDGLERSKWDSRTPSPPVRSGSCRWSSCSRAATSRTSSRVRSPPPVWASSSAPHLVTTRCTAAASSLGTSTSTFSTGSHTRVPARPSACCTTMGVSLR